MIVIIEIMQQSSSVYFSLRILRALTPLISGTLSSEDGRDCCRRSLGGLGVGQPSVVHEITDSHGLLVLFQGGVVPDEEERADVLVAVFERGGDVSTLVTNGTLGCASLARSEICRLVLR